MNCLRPSRRQLLRASLIGGIAIYLAPLGSRAFASRRGGLLRLNVGRPDQIGSLSWQLGD